MGDGSHGVILPYAGQPCPFRGHLILWPAYYSSDRTLVRLLAQYAIRCRWIAVWVTPYFGLIGAEAGCDSHEFAGWPADIRGLGRPCGSSRMFAAALALLARADHGDLAAWQAVARYLLCRRH